MPRARAQSAGLARTSLGGGSTVSDALLSGVGSIDAGFLASTVSRDQRVAASRIPPEEDGPGGRYHQFHQAETEALWRGVKPSLATNESASAHAALHWEAGEPRRPSTAYTSRKLAPAVAANNPLIGFAKFQDEITQINHARAHIFGANFESLSAFPSATAATEAPTVKAPQRPASAAHYAATARSTRPSTAAPATARPYVAQRVARDDGGMVEKIGSFPAPTPLEPDAKQWFRDNAYTTDLSFFHAQGRMGPGQKPTTRLGMHGRVSSQSLLVEEALRSRDPAMDDALYSSFSGDRVFRENTPSIPAPTYRSKACVALPLPSGEYLPQERLFFQTLDRSQHAQQPKADIRIKQSIRTMADVEARAEASRVFVTVVDSEAVKAARKAKADKAYRTQLRQIKRFGAVLFDQPPALSRPRSPSLQPALADLDLQAYLDGGARTPSGRRSPTRRVVISSPSPPRSVSPNHLDRFGVTNHWRNPHFTTTNDDDAAPEVPHALETIVAPHTARPTGATPRLPTRPQSAFVPTAITSSGGSSGVASPNPARRSTLLGVRAELSLARAFAFLAPMPLSA